jgi:hypothetical protein
MGPLRWHGVVQVGRPGTGITMVYTIHLEAAASGEMARAAVARAPRGEVALVFPWGRPCALSDASWLAALYDACAARDILLVIVGGDHLLRAHAVAAGFAAATSIEEWETSKHRALRASRGVAHPRRRARGTWAVPDVRLVAISAKDTAEHDGDDLYALYGEDPPSYVADLVAHERSLREDRHTLVPTVPLQRGRATRVLSETLRDRREAEALERAHQLFEERLTETIRQSADPITAPRDESDTGGQENGADG